jgi:hypothetical protein
MAQNKLRGLLCWTLVLCILLVVESAALPTSNASDLVNSFTKRQCVFNDNTFEWDCDNVIPTVPQIVARLQDKQNYGAALEGARPVFYTNLLDGERTPAKAWEAFSWCVTWLEANKVPSYYLAGTAVDPAWYNAQEKQ